MNSKADHHDRDPDVLSGADFDNTRTKQFIIELLGQTTVQTPLRIHGRRAIGVNDGIAGAVGVVMVLAPLLMLLADRPSP